MTRRTDALDYHERGRAGKIEVVSSKPLTTQRHLSLAYSPGVAEPCLEIAKNPESIWEYTARGNLVAVITNGTAVLGLGNIGPMAGKPVMEGKACLFKKFADVDVFDLEINITDVDQFVEVVAALEPTFGGINLEDVKAPECFEIESRLRERLSIPVFHDDQHGTAIISGAALINACEVAGKQLSDIKVVVSGAGASALACAQFWVSLGVERRHVTMVDSRGVIFAGRERVNEHKKMFAGPDCGARTLADALVDADVFLGLSVGGVVNQAMVKSMAACPIVFALANPDPEIDYEDAMSARDDVIVATGRSDHPNQVNNVLGFPYIFRGALDVRATSISEEMKIAAARALAALAHEPVSESVIDAYGGKTLSFGPEYIIPTHFDARTLWWVAPAVAKAAQESGVARRILEIEEYGESLKKKMGGAAYSITRDMVRGARANPKRIVFPEAANPKLLRAVQIIVEEGIAEPILLGRREEIELACASAGIDFLDRVEIVEPRSDSRYLDYAKKLYELRQRKGITAAGARGQMVKSNYFGMMMLKSGDVDGLVGGLKLPFPKTVRPALEILGLKPGVKVATGMYMMALKHQVKFFADCTVNISPSADVLADIAIQVSDAVTELGVEPRVALVSFSNFGSVRHPEVDKVQQAVALIRDARPQLIIDGEMQADIALNSKKLESQFPFSRLPRAANVLVFPSLVSGNASYKVLQALGGAQAFGPMLLGISKPVTVLQPQSPVDGIVNMTAYTVRMAQRMQR